MSRDPWADLSLTDASGAYLSWVWLADGSVQLSIGGDQPLDQPPCSIKLTPEMQAQIAALLDGRQFPARIKLGDEA
jgi:hypothetical protein